MCLPAFVCFPAMFQCAPGLFINPLWYLSMCLSFTLHWLVCFPAAVPPDLFVLCGFMVCQLFCVLFLLNSCLEFVRCPFVVSYLPVSLHLQFLVLAFPLAIHPSNRWIN